MVAQVYGVSGCLVLDPASPQALSGGSTIAVSAEYGSYPLTATGAVTGLILAAGTAAGGQVTLVNRSAYTLAFAAPGTSRVADGTSDAIPALAARSFTWDAGTSLWYRCA